MQAQFVLASGTCWVHPRRRSNSEAGPSRDTSARPTAGLYRDAQQRMRSGRGGPSMTNRSGHHCAWRLRNGATRGLMFTTIFPIIATPDLAAALAFYRDFSGRRSAMSSPGPTANQATSDSNLARLTLASVAIPPRPRGGASASASVSTPTIAMQLLNACARPASTSSRSRSTSHGANG